MRVLLIVGLIAAVLFAVGHHKGHAPGMLPGSVSGCTPVSPSPHRHWHMTPTPRIPGVPKPGQSFGVAYPGD